MNLVEARPFVIADVGSNFKRYDSDEKNLACAMQHISRAAQCGVSAVKFQLYTHRELYGFDGPNPWALPRHFILPLAEKAKACGVEFMCSAFSEDGIWFLDPYVSRHKLASSEFTHTQMLNALIETGKPFIVSTGAASFHEILKLIDTVPASRKLTIMECAAAYPAEESDYSISLLRAVRESSPSIHLGLSDHTLSDIVAIAAVGAGATVFEKHFDALYDEDGSRTPDSPVSIGPSALRSYVDAVELASRAMGPKRLRANEKDMVAKHRRRLKVIQPIKAGETFKSGVNFGIYRSLTEDREALSPAYLGYFDGHRAKRNFAPGDGITAEDLS